MDWRPLLFEALEMRIWKPWFLSFWERSIWAGRRINKPLGYSIGEGNGTPLQYSCLENPMDGGAWCTAVHGVASRTQLSDFTFTFHFHALEKEMATHSSVLAWRIPGTGEPGGLPSLGSHRVRHDWSDLAAAAGYNMMSYKIEEALLVQRRWPTKLSTDGNEILSKWMGVKRKFQAEGKIWPKVWERMSSMKKIPSTEPSIFFFFFQVRTREKRTCEKILPGLLYVWTLNIAAMWEAEFLDKVN